MSVILTQKKINVKFFIILLVKVLNKSINNEMHPKSFSHITRNKKEIVKTISKDIIIINL